ncbi:hypothetical protein J437_LFUL003112 [Ladona fulva]|uniref:Uncharacterized protein n=1 Tax=Ladona fulva TaxID=123851 RepID=A0A8K0NW13_LADFU|nr:hypothetical protein J437_LFUL003112 [Ladona fulva]
MGCPAWTPSAALTPSAAYPYVRTTCCWSRKRRVLFSGGRAVHESGPEGVRIAGGDGAIRQPGEERARRHRTSPAATAIRGSGDAGCLHRRNPREVQGFYPTPAGHALQAKHLNEADAREVAAAANPRLRVGRLQQPVGCRHLPPAGGAKRVPAIRFPTRPHGSHDEVLQAGKVPQDEGEEEDGHHRHRPESAEGQRTFNHRRETPPGGSARGRHEEREFFVRRAPAKVLQVEGSFAAPFVREFDKLSAAL